MYLNLSWKLENVFSFFERTKKIDERNIEQVMLDISEDHKKADYKHLYTLLENQEIYIPAHSATLPDGVEPASKYIPSENDKIKIKIIDGPNDQPLIPAATYTGCAVLHHGYLRISWIDFLNMILKIEDADGAFLECESCWVRFEKYRIEYVLDFYTQN